MSQSKPSRNTSPRSKPAPEPGSGDTRRRILEAATRIIVERGIGGLRIRELARAVGIREGSIYNHYAGRDQIIKAIFEQVDAGMSPLGETLDLERTPKEQLHLAGEEVRARGLAGFLSASGKYLLEHFARNPDSLRLLRAILSARFHDPSARRAYDEVFRRDMERALLTIFHLAAEQGLLRESVRPQDLTGLVMAGFEQAIADSFADDGTRRFAASIRKSMDLIGTLASR
jgi:AcrR family transcriptional regulator